MAARLLPGEKVVDLGCGGGIDVILAAREVGPAGLVVGIDVLPPMLSRARIYAEQAGLASVAFACADLRLLPFPAGTFDVAISNNAFNLLGDRRAALAEAYRVLKPGGRLALADTVATGSVTGDEGSGAWAGLPTPQEYERLAPESGFEGVLLTLGPVMPLSGAVRARPMMLLGARRR